MLIILKLKRALLRKKCNFFAVTRKVTIKGLCEA